jgi:hypothetical protein
VRAKTMHATTKSKILNDGQPFAATTSAPRANGSAKIVCEKRISRRNRHTDPPSLIPLGPDPSSSELSSCLFVSIRG